MLKRYFFIEKKNKINYIGRVKYFYSKVLEIKNLICYELNLINFMIIFFIKDNYRRNCKFWC